MSTVFLHDIEKVEFIKPYVSERTTFDGIKNSAGVYFIKENGILVYIGMSRKSLYKTIYRHFQKWIDRRSSYEIQYSNPPYPRVTYKHFLGEKNYEIFYFFTEKDVDPHTLEKEYIRKYKPRDNKEKYEIYLSKLNEPETPVYEDPRCMTCKEELTISNNGMVLNKGHITQCYICDDCHLMEFGVHIMTDLFIFPVERECNF